MIQKNGSYWFSQWFVNFGPQSFLDALSACSTCTLFFRPLVVDSAHRLSSLHYKVAFQILPQLWFTMFFLLLNQLFHRCLVYLCNLVYVTRQPCGEVGTSTFTPPVYFAHLQTSNLRTRHDVHRIVKSICGTVFTFWCGHCPKCRTVVSLGLVSAHRLAHLLSTFRICNNQSSILHHKVAHL